MRLPTGKLAATDKDNEEVLEPHFGKVFINHHPIEWNLIDEIKQRQTMYELNALVAVVSCICVYPCVHG